MARSGMKLLVAAVAVVTVAAACSSSSKSTSGSGHTITIGVLTDYTGPGAAANKASVMGVKAGIVYAKRNGYTIKYVLGDTGTSPGTALTAAQHLVQQDHVFAVVAYSAVAFGAASYLHSQGIPVVGSSIDGPEWISDTNMFSVTGALHTDLVTTTTGKFFKLEGATVVGALGYSISPASAEAAKGATVSAKHAGLKVGYLNANFPFGSTNVQPIALAMKSAGVNGVTATVDPNTGYALVNALKQVGATPKVAVFPTGYGADVLNGGPGAVQSGQDAYFSLGFEPVEMHTAATKQFSSDLKAAGVNGDPSFSMYNGYLSVGLLVRGLKGAGSSPTQASLIKSLSQIHNWDSLGLWGGRTLDINNRKDIAGGPGNCEWFTKLVGNNFQLVSGADPMCGTVIPGVTVSG